MRRGEVRGEGREMLGVRLRGTKYANFNSFTFYKEFLLEILHHVSALNIVLVNINQTKVFEVSLILLSFI